MIIENSSRKIIKKNHWKFWGFSRISIWDGNSFSWVVTIVPHMYKSFYIEQRGMARPLVNFEYYSNKPLILKLINLHKSTKHPTSPTHTRSPSLTKTASPHSSRKTFWRDRRTRQRTPATAAAHQLLYRDGGETREELSCERQRRRSRSRAAAHKSSPARSLARKKWEKRDRARARRGRARRGHLGRTPCGTVYTYI